jgi:hypothetical protein
VFSMYNYIVDIVYLLFKTRLYLILNLQSEKRVWLLLHTKCHILFSSIASFSSSIKDSRWACIVLSRVDGNLILPPQQTRIEGVPLVHLHTLCVCIYRFTQGRM